jgi:hypothetical protein
MPAESATDCTPRQVQFVTPVAGDVANEPAALANALVRHVLLKEAVWRYAIYLIDQIGIAEAARRLGCAESKVRQIQSGRGGDVNADVVSVLSGKTASDLAQQLAVWATTQENPKSDAYKAAPLAITIAQPVQKARGRAAQKAAEPKAPKSRRELRDAGVVASERLGELDSSESEPSTPPALGRRRTTRPEPKPSR